MEDDAGLQDTELERETCDLYKQHELLDMSLDYSSHCSTILSPEHSSLQSDKILISSPISATMQICCNMRSDAGHGVFFQKCLPNFDNFSKETASCNMRSLSGRGRAVSLMKSKKVASEGRATKQGKVQMWSQVFSAS